MVASGQAWVIVKRPCPSTVIGVAGALRVSTSEQPSVMSAVSVAFVSAGLENALSRSVAVATSVPAAGVAVTTSTASGAVSIVAAASARTTRPRTVPMPTFTPGAAIPTSTRH